MHIETYIVEETQNLIYDNTDLQEWSRLTKELGLDAQKAIVREDKSPIPFLPMNTRITNILKELCPTEIDIKQYRVTPIPLDVLKLVSMSVKERYFGEIKIMYDETSKDPACFGITPGWQVDNANGSRQEKHGTFHTKEECEKFILDNGLTGHKAYHYSGNKYLIARWADVKQTWEELAERARNLYCQRQCAELKKDLIETQGKLDNVQNEAVLRFS